MSLEVSKFTSISVSFRIAKLEINKLWRLPLQHSLTSSSGRHSRMSFHPFQCYTGSSHRVEQTNFTHVKHPALTSKAAFWQRSLTSKLRTLSSSWTQLLLRCRPHPVWSTLLSKHFLLSLQLVAPTFPLTRTCRSIIFWMGSLLRALPQMDPVWAQGHSMMKPAGLCPQSRGGNVVPMNSAASATCLSLQKSAHNSERQRERWFWWSRHRHQPS